MTDRGEGELRKWALKRNGDPPSNEDIVALVFAFADDFDTAHQETLTFFSESRADRSDLRAQIVCLQDWRESSENTCQERVLKLITKEHDQRHDEHMESHHSIDATFQQKFIWWWGGKIGYIVVAVLITSINILLNYLWFGTP